MTAGRRRSPLATMKPIWWLVIVGGVGGMASCGACVAVVASYKPPQQQAAALPAASAVVASIAPAADPPRRPDLGVTAHEMVTDYNSNEIRADQKYKGKLVGIAGRVEDVKKDAFGNAYVTITSHKDQMERMLLPTVHCRLTKESEARASELTPGQLAAFGGTVEGMVLNIITVEDCRVKAVGDAGAQP